MIKRAILGELRKHLESKEISLIVGPRQAGKTYLMQALKEELERQAKKVLFLNLDLEQDRQYFSSQKELVEKIKREFGNTEGVVFIDEIQRKENAGLFLKGIFDMNLPYKLVVSGSGSLELKEKIHESLAGRKQIFEVNPISFNEFVHFKTEYKYEDRINDFLKTEGVRTMEYLDEYLTFGGYPRVILANTVTEKRTIMGEIYQSYVERDLIDLLHLEKTNELTDLLKIMASQIGSIVNISELSGTVGISGKTIQKYLWYLEKTFILKKVTPFSSNKRSEITKAPVYYFNDTGLRNYILGLFGVPIPTLLSGHLFENFVFNVIDANIAYTSTSIHFWRSLDDAEVDFILKLGASILPVEVKYSKLQEPTVTRSFASFVTKYKPPTGLFVHLGDNLESKVDNTDVHFLPFFLLKDYIANLN